MSKWIRSLVFSFGFLMVAVFALAGCSASLAPFLDNPQASDVVRGNGTLAVSKGEYLYFVNGYLGYAEVGDTNHNGKITYSALYRIKLDSRGLPVEVEPKYDEDGEVIFDGSKALKNVELMVSKVVGFEFTGIYIFGDYLYYASPHNGKDSELKVMAERIDFFRIRLDRSTAPEWVYTSSSAGEQVEYGMLAVGNEVYMNVLDGEKLIGIKYTANNQKSMREVANGVSGMAFARHSSSNEVCGEMEDELYYTRAIDQELDNTNAIEGNVLCKYNLKTQKSEVLLKNGSNITLKWMGQDKLYYQKSNENLSSESHFYACRLPFNKTNPQEEKITHNTYEEYFLTPSGNNTVVVKSQGSLVVFNYPNCADFTLYSGSATVVKIQGEFVYFIAEDALQRINYMQFAKFVKGEITTQPSAERLTNSEVSFKTSSVNLVCVSGEKAYFLQRYDSGNYYLHMLDLSELDAESGEYSNYFVGVLQAQDYLTQSE